MEYDEDIPPLQKILNKLLRLEEEISEVVHKISQMK
jgi:hypothetical protein